MHVDRKRMRAEFEAWILTPSPGLHDSAGYGGNRLDLDKDGDGTYRLMDVQKMWMAWQTAWVAGQVRER